MNKPINLIFTGRPSIHFTALLALFGRSSKFNPDDNFPQITASWNKAVIDKDQLAQFHKLCDITDGGKIPVAFPCALTYPLLQRILAHKEAPLSLFQVLNSRMQIFQHRAIGIDEMFDIFCSITAHRLREKGLEMDITSTIRSAGVPVWENVQTFYYRGKFGKADESYQPPRYEPIPDAPVTAQWFLREGIGKAFSRVSADGNPIHFRKFYARLFGFKRDFAQPLLVLGKALSYLEEAQGNNPVSLDIALKAPIYYASNVILKSAAVNNLRRFDVYQEGNDLPCICGKVKIGA